MIAPPGAAVKRPRAGFFPRPASVEQRPPPAAEGEGPRPGAGLSGETAETWAYSVRRAIETGVHSITVYKLEVYANTEYYSDLRRQQITVPSDDSAPPPESAPKESDDDLEKQFRGK